jgi:hypothetical protein
MTDEKLTPTIREMDRARDAYAKAFGKTSRTSLDGAPDNPMVTGRAKVYALVRQYPDVGALLLNLNMDAPRGFGSVDVGLPNDPVYGHVVLDVEDFLDYALAGEIVLGEDGQPDYIGTERLRG